MIASIPLIVFDLVVELSKSMPQLLTAISNLKAKGDPSDADIAAERAILASIDVSDPLGKVPDPIPGIPLSELRPGL